MDKCNEFKSLTDLMNELDLTPQPDTDYGYSTDIDVLEYSIHSLAASAAINNIRNFVNNFYPSDHSLQYHALYSYLNQFDLSPNSTNVIETLVQIRNHAFNNIYVCEEWDQIKCFLRLMSCSGTPAFVTDVASDDPIINRIYYKDFEITRTFYCDFDELSYSINLTFHKLRLLLAGDVEQNPGPPTHSKLQSEEKDQDQRKMLNQLRREIEKLKKSQSQQQNFVQRQLELEKRDRKKKREMGHDRKRYAQTLITDTVNKIKKDVASVCSDSSVLAETAKATGYLAANVVLPGAGTAAAAVVNGSKLSTAVNKINPTIDMLQNVLKTLTSAADSLKEIFSVPKDYDIIGILISLMSICNCLKEKNLLLLTLHCTNLARQFGITLDSLISLIPTFDTSSISFTFGSNTQRVGQSLVSDMFTTAISTPELLPFAGFLSFLCGAFSLLCTGVVPSPGEMTKHFSNVGRAAQGFRALKELFNWVYDYLAEIYYTTVYGMSVEEYQFMQNFPQLENLYAAVKLIEKFDKTLLDSSAGIANQTLTVNHQLNEYHYQASKMQSRPNTQLITSLQRRIKDQAEWATHSPARCHTIRTQPVALYLFGHPGVGKSVATEVLKARIFKKYLKDQGIKYESSSFPRRAKNEYWEGYTGQPIVVLDDFGNVKDSQQKPVEEYEELEYMVNTAQFPLKMAELKSKGVTNFTSDYIIASSNQKYPEIKSLVDPGAVYRRFHVWADVTIDPAYGVPIGKDETGNAYYTFDKETIAKLKNISVDEVAPLTVEHYRFTCYKVIHNKQTGNAEVNYISGKSGLKFDDFWEFFVGENERRKTESVALANAIRKEAGIATPEAPATEQQILDEFDKIFKPDKFIETVAAEESFDVELGDDYFDAEGDEVLGSIAHIFNMKLRLSKVKEMFYTSKNNCKSTFAKLWTQLKACVTLAGNKLLSVAQFLLSFISSLAQKSIDYLPSVPSSKILIGICSTAGAFLGVWYAGMFHSQPSDILDSWCQFNRSPSNATVPCGKCSSCTIIEYPSTGDMLAHFLDRTGIKSVRNDLLALGLKRDDIEDIREQLRREQPKRRSQRKCALLHYASQDNPEQTYQEAYQMLTSTCLAGCQVCDDLEIDDLDMNNERDVVQAARDVWFEYSRSYAQRVYETQPRVARTVNYAQRVYDTQPTVPKHRQFAQKTYEHNPRMPKTQRLAQSMVECKTEMHIGARKYAQRDRVQIEQTTQVLLNNSVWIQAVDGKGMCSRSNGVFLVGRTMITTAHTILNPPHIDPIEYLIIRNPYSTEAAIKIPIDQCKISQTYQLDGSPVDLALVSFPPVVPNRPRILSKFLGSEDIGLLKEGDLTFSGFYEVNGKTIVQEKYPSSFSVSTKTTEYFLHKPGTCPKDSQMCKCPIKIGNHIDYDLETVSGMCGALLSISNRLIHTKLIGFHVAGGAGVLALGALTTKQFLEQALTAHVEKFEIPRSYLIDGRLPYSQSWVDPTCKVSLVELGDCLNVGTAPSPAAPTTTQLAPSLIFDKVQQHIAKPAFLKPVKVEGEGVVDPMLKGIKKIMGGQTFVDPDLLEAAANDVFQGLGKPITGKGIVHSYEEAIVGVEGDPYKRPINRTTSPGYPYNLSNKSKGKTAWLGDGEDYIVDNPELKQDVQNLLNDSRQGIRGNAISIATLKDEKRPIAKVDAGKTRVFEACPQHLVIAIRQYFLDFSAHVMRNRIDNGIAVGINPYSLEWTKLAHHLQSMGNYMIAGDFSNFDGSLLMQILVKIVEKINEWYDDGEEAQLIRSALWEHICNADILVKGEVIRKTHSQPSGNPLTVIINSLFNGIVMRIAYMLLKVKKGLPAVCDYRKHVSEIIYGDDDIKSVSVEIIDWFNQLTLTDALASFGLTYTDETKTGIILPFKTLEEVAFLKRKFVIQKDGTFLAPMDLENTLEITNWIRGKASRAATIENCEQTITELALHPQNVYEFWSTRIREELAKVKINILIPTFYEQMEAYKYNRDLYARTEYVPLW
uniref:Replicative protein n=1 Tax=Halhan virus 1 TaxID=2480176 RepID=A0A3G2LQH1_9VIRU|nr:replicative protein [Halhan virus 1]